MNLVINGAEAIGERGGALTVATGMRAVAASDESLWRASGQPLAPGRYVLLEVRDDGPGMDAKTVDRIFEPFFTTKFTGRGLGLAAVLGVVRGHRGGLSVESAPGRGTVFRILLAPSAQVSDLEAPAAAKPDRRDLTLLLIDDEEVVRDMVAEVLEHEGCRCCAPRTGPGGLRSSATSGNGSTSSCSTSRCPGCPGRRLSGGCGRSIRRYRSSFRRAMTTTRRGAGLAKSTPAGFIQKPYRPEQLMAEIGRCLRRTSD